MKKATRILIVEDNPADAELAERAICKVLKGCTFHLVETRKDFLKALETFQPDVIVADYALPRFDGLTALKLARKHAPLTPVIMWTGATGEDIAVDCLKAGANNYVLKENIKRLGPAVLRALEDREALLARKQAEEKYQAIFENSVVGIFQSTPQGRYLNVNAAMARIYGYDSPEEMTEAVKDIKQQIYVDADRRAEFIELLNSQNTVEHYEGKNYRKDRSIIWTSTSARAARDTDGNVLYYEGFITDITPRKKAEEELKERERQLTILFSNLPGPVYRCQNDANYTMDFISDGIRELSGYTAEDFQQHRRDYGKLIHAEDREQVWAEIQTAVEQKQPFELTYRIVTATGEEKWVWEKGQGVYDPKGQLQALEGFITDITARKRAEEVIQTSEKRFRALIENGPDNISLLAADGTLLWESPATSRMLGYAPDEFVGRNIFELIHPDDFEWTRALYSKLVSEPGSHQSGVFRLHHSNGTWHWVEAIATNLLNEPGINAVVINYRDITEHKQVEEALREERNLLRTLIDNIPDRIYAMDIHGRKTLSNTADWQASGGKTMEDVIGKAEFDIYPPDLAEEFWQLDQAVLDSGQPVINYEEPGLDVQGNRVSILTTKIPLRDSEGKVLGLVGIGRDITERKQVEEKLRQSENRYRLAVKATNDVIWETNLQPKQLFWSENAQIVFGYTPEEVDSYETWWDDHLHPDDRARVLSKMNSLIESNESLWMDEYRFQLKNGSYAYISDRGYIERDRNGTPLRMIGAMTNITERKQAEDKLRESENRLFMALSGAQMSVWEWDLKTNQITWSPEFFRITGVNAEQFGGSFESFTDLIHIDDLERVRNAAEKAMKGQTLFAEEFRIICPDGEVRWLSNLGQAEYDSTGTYLRLIGTVQDVTQRKQAETERQALLEIMQGIANTEDLHELLQLIHHSVARVVYAKNFFIVLHQPEKSLFEEIYSVDQYDPPAPPDKLEKSLTSYVFRTGEPLLLTKVLFDELIQRGEARLVGTDSASWLGVPLKTSGRTIGVMVVQDYEIDNRYSERDKQFLASIATQVALAIERKHAETALRESEEHYRAIFEGVQDAIFVESLDGKILNVNEQACEMFGYSHGEFLTKTVRDLVPDGNLILMADDKNSLLTAEPHETLNRRANGEIFPIDISGRLQVIDGETVFLVVVRDITERKQAEEALREAETKYRTLVEQLPAVTYLDVIDESLRSGEFKTSYISPQVEGLLGYPPHAFQTDPDLWTELIHPDDRERVLARIAAYYQHMGFYHDEYRMRTWQGNEIWIRDEAIVVRGNGNKQPFSQGVVFDITERKRMEVAEREQRVLSEALRDTAEILSSTLDYGEVLDHILAAVGRVVPHDAATIMIINGEQAHVVRLHGYDQDNFNTEIMGLRLPLAKTTNLRQMLETRQPVVVYDTHSYPDWQRMPATDWLRSSVGAPILIYGEIIGFICLDGQEPGFFTPVHAERLEAFANQAALAIHNARLLQQAQEEIAERKHAEEELRFEKDRLEKIAAAVPGLIGSLRLRPDGSGHMPFASPAIQDVYGFLPAELQEDITPFFARVHAEDLPQLHAAIQESSRSLLPWYGEFRYHHPTKGEVWIEGRSMPLREEDGSTIWHGFLYDITERKRAEQELRASEERFRQLADNIQEVFWMTDAETGEEIYLSPAAEAIWRQPLETLRHEPNALINSVFPEDQPRVLENLEKEKAGEKAELEYRIVRPDGSLRWIWDRAFPIFDDSGKVKRIAGISADITDRKQAEYEIRRRAEENSILLKTSLALTNLDLQTTLQTVGDSAKNLFAADGCRIFLMEPEGKSLRCVLALQENLNAFADLRIRVGEGVTGSVAESGQAEIVNRMQNDARAVQVPGTPDEEEAIMFAPLREREETIGVLSIRRTGSERPFELADLAGLEALASIAASAVSNARLFAETQRRLAELEALYENGLAVGRLLRPNQIGHRVINTFARYLRWHHVTISLREESSDNLELVAFNLSNLEEEERTNAEQHFIAPINKVGQGLSGWVTQTGLPLRAGHVQAHPQYIDTHTGIQSGLYMPLKVGERVIGVISVESEAPDAFTEQDERLLATLASQAAIAFENARLYQAIEQELSERKRAEEALRTSETHYRELADSITDILFELDHELRYTHWNKASEMFSGISAQDAIGRPMQELFETSEEQSRREEIYISVLKERRAKSFETEILAKGQKRALEINAYPSARGVSVVAKDVTDRKRAEIIMQKRFALMEYSAHHSLEELMQRTVDEVSELTGSAIGFFHFVEENKNALGRQTWSTDALKLFNVPASEGTHLPLDQAGVWAEAVHQRRPLIQNDYGALTDKKGFAQGHVPITREIVVPIIRNEKVMAVMGIGNKPQEYTSYDLEVAERLADYAWDITERKQMQVALEIERNQLAKRVEERTSDLSQANSNLARALRVKDEFLANMSHELRTPLNAILGLSESLGEQIAGPLNEKQQKYITTISESGHHLLALINDILDLAKIEAGQITLDINKVDIHQVCQASLRMIKQLAQKKNQDVVLEIGDGVELMWADERRLKQMIVNLLGNAVKFTPEHGKIGLGVHGDQVANKISITVWDNGIGIKEDDLARLFQPFVQLDSGLAREATGTGLGLALVAQMARLHGGSVSAMSEPGKGSRFSIVLPWEPGLVMDASSRLRTTGKFPAIKPDETNRPTILLVEDSKEVIMMIRDYLELAGYTVVVARDGVEAITQARLVHPDLILMDVMMPRMDGFEATRKLRSEPEFKYTPIIALTALAMPSDRERCLAAGMDEYISKPINFKALVRMIQSCLFSSKESRP